MRVLFVLFIVMPVVEMAVLIQVGSFIGVLNTIALVLLTAIIGAALLRQQGLATLLRANERMNSGELPAHEVAEGLVLAVGGALLLTPGFVTDAIGFLCLLPGSRHWLVSRALKHLTVSGGAAYFRFSAGGDDPFATGDPFRSGPSGPRSPFDRDENGDIIEGEYRDNTPHDYERLPGDDDRDDSRR